MSRRSLRLDDGLLDRGLPRSSASFSAGGGAWRSGSSSRSLKPRRSQHSVTCSESLLLSTPRRAPGPPLLNSSLHSVASDASLLSSLLDQSSAQDATLVDAFWGLDQDVDPEGCTVIAEESGVLAERTVIGPDGRCPKHLLQPLSSVYCRDCELHADGDAAAAHANAHATRTRHRGTRLQPEPAATLRDGHFHHLQQRAEGAQEPDRWSRSLRGHEVQQQQPEAGPARRVSVRPLLLVLLPLLLLLSFTWFGPWALQSVSIPEWRTAVSGVPGLSSVSSFMSPHSPPSEGGVQEPRDVQLLEEEPLHRGRPAAAEEEGAKEVVEEAMGAKEAGESLRLAHLEQSLAALWERVEAGGRRAEQRHVELLRLHSDLQQQMVSGQKALEPWLSRQLDQQLDQDLDLDQVWTPLDQQTEQQRETSRLDQLELQLQTLAARTEEEQRRRGAATPLAPSPATLPAAASGGVDRPSHDALLEEVARLEAALGDVRREVEGLSGCQDGCQRLDSIQQTISEQVSAQVREDVRVLVYGNQLMVGGGASGDGVLPESLLQLLSQRYISGAALQAALASLELSILQNISQQLEQPRSEEAVPEAVLHAPEAAGAAVTQEDVHVIVKDALRLFSQDRTGLADYALESGGGSVLSTRCSETYETKAALLSLFGLPLWYFSQSPRAVIQPDVHPGNCWAFRGSRGFLVLRLSMRIVPSSFSLEHVPRILAPSGTLHSAPRDFAVYGLEDESEDRGTPLGSFTYDEDGEALQTFTAAENDGSFQIIEVQVFSNWGHPEYTCMYRFRVHGTPADA